jgi:hypothetical protein
LLSRWKAVPARKVRTAIAGKVVKMLDWMAAKDAV